MPKLNYPQTIYKRAPHLNGGILLEYGVKHILNFYYLLQGPGILKSVLANHNEAKQSFSQTAVTHYAEKLLHELFSSISRINCPTPIGSTKKLDSYCVNCVISLAQYI